MATAYHTATTHDDAISSHWDHSVPAVDKLTNLHHDNRFELDPYSYSNSYKSENGAPDYALSRPALRSQSSGNLNMNTYPQDLRSTHQAQQSRPSPAYLKHAPPEKKRSVGTGLNAEQVDDSAWIHRDKLARIESREMAQAGISMRRTSRRRESASESRSASRSASRASIKRAQGQERSLPDDPSSSVLPPFQEYSQEESSRETRHRAASDEDDDMDYDPAMLMKDPSLRGPPQQYSKTLPASLTRPTTSRIPIAKASPAPVSSAVVERDSPLPRSRGGSNPWNTISNDLAYQNRRSRSQSLGSQAIMDDVAAPRISPTSHSRPTSAHLQQASHARRGSKSSSPPKPKTTTKPPVSSVSSRKGTNKGVATGSARSRTTSAARKTSPNSRPVSSSATRPNTSVKRPEGEAPWIATMYKPDPRLPPDQQILPTHAKRMMQEQWEKDGTTGSAYDRDFNLLNDNDLAKMGAFPAPSPALEQSPHAGNQPNGNTGSQSTPWPLSSNQSERSSLRPGTSSGGYKITPTVPLPSPSASVLPGQGQSRKSVQRVPDLDEKEDGKKDKTCGCCIVM